MQKEQRQTRILSLISERPIRKQDALAEILLKEGFPVTQSSVSRDLIELGVVKVGGKYAVPSRETGAGGVSLLRAVPAGDNLIVAKTDMGLASAACVRLDGAGIPGIIGTVAGEDTIFIAVADRTAQREVLKAITRLFKS